MADSPLPSHVRAVGQVDVSDRAVIVLECDAPLTHEAREALRAQLLELWPTHTVLVLDPGMRLRVITGHTGVEVDAAPC
jgi:hypothetical protein